MQGILKYLLPALLAAIASRETVAAVQLQVGSAGGSAGTSVPVPLSLQSDTPVTAFQVDLIANPPVITFDAAAEVESLTTHVADIGLVAPGVFRVVIYSVFNAPIANGAVLTLQAAISPLAANGPVSLLLSNAIVSLPLGIAIPNPTLASGTVNVGPVGSIRLSNLSLSGGNLQFQVTGLSAPSFTVESSTDLASWQTFATRPAAGATASFSSTAPVGDKLRFFRVRIP